jgi:predicted TPR repeat methyltransferase
LHPFVIEAGPIEAALALIASGQAHQAVLDLRARLAEGRGGALARITLVRALLASQDVAGALAEAREAVSLNPDLPEVLVALGEALLAAENLPAAIAELQRALRADPGHARARHLTAMAWLEAGEADKALEMFHGLDEETAPDLAEGIARAEAIKSAARSDPGYVRHLFDQFSADYDSRMLGQLGYAVPSILAELADLVMAGRGGLRILDLGCGTGLAGVAFKPRAARLDGIDLSPAMIEKARARGLYDSLMVADLESALAAPGAAYDLIVAADTLVYLGDLASVFAAAATRLAGEGFFLFTLEKAEKEGFELGPKRRWRHSEAYVRALADDMGLCVAGLVAAAPRSESGMPVPGLAVALTKP